MTLKVTQNINRTLFWHHTKATQRARTSNFQNNWPIFIQCRTPMTLCHWKPLKSLDF